MKERMYKHLRERGESMTYYELTEWYNNTDHRMLKDKAGGAQHGTTGYVVSNILAKSMLFEEDGYKEEARGISWSSRKYKLYKARPIDEVVERAIASRRPLKRFPKFVRQEIERRGVLDENN